MRNSAGEFLSQDLMRAAFKTKGLKPFEVPLRVMREAECLFRRADAYKAAMFGLAGITFHGWESTVITKRAEDLSHTASASYEYQFTEGTVEPVDIPEASWGMARGPRSVGTLALAELGDQLESSAFSYMSASKGKNIHNGIDTHDVLETMWAIAREVEGTDILTVPFAFVRNQNTGKYERALSPFRLNSSHCKISFKDRLALPASNFARFTETPIDRLMQGFVEPIPGYRGVEIQHDCTESEIPGIISRLMADTVRATQRVDGATTRIRPQRFEEISLIKNNKGEYCLTWPSREQDPPHELCPYDEAPTSGRIDQPVLNREKCPIGYTELGEVRMPGQRIAIATQKYMDDNSLFDPRIFKRRSNIPTF